MKSFRSIRVTLSAIIGLAVYSTYMAYARFPPAREGLGEPNLTPTWLIITLVGAAMGVIVCGLILYRRP